MVGWGGFFLRHWKNLNVYLFIVIESRRQSRFLMSDSVYGLPRFYFFRRARRHIRPFFLLLTCGHVNLHVRWDEIEVSVLFLFGPLLEYKSDLWLWYFNCCFSFLFIFVVHHHRCSFLLLLVSAICCSFVMSKFLQNPADLPEQRLRDKPGGEAREKSDRPANTAATTELMTARSDGIEVAMYEVRSLITSKKLRVLSGLLY